MADPHALPGGPLALRARLEELGLTAYALAKRLDVNLSVVSRWLSGERLPSTPSALALQAEIGLPVEVWARPLATAPAPEAPPAEPPAPAALLPAVHEEPSAPQLSTLTERYRWIFENRNTNASRLAHEAGLSRSHIRDQISLAEAGKKVSPTIDTVESIARAADVSFLWLAVGHGEPGHFSNPGVFAPEARPEGTTDGQEPIWEKLQSLEKQVRHEGADIHPSDMADALARLAETARADLVREWHRGHETGISEERERIRRDLLGRVGALRAEQSRRSREAADFTHRAHKAAEKEAEAMTMADAIEAAALGLSEGEG